MSNGHSSGTSFLCGQTTFIHSFIYVIFVSIQVPRVELTLSELQEMATRQQQQIEAQQQMLVAKVNHEPNQLLDCLLASITLSTLEYV